MDSLFLLSEILMTKLCHDLAGITSAIDYCSELISDPNKAVQTKSSELLPVNSKKLISRLKFYRYTYGAIEHLNNLGLSELKELVNISLDLTSSKIILNLSSNLNNYEIMVNKIIICLIISAAENIIRDGIIDCNLQMKDEKLSVVVKPIGGHQKFYAEKIGILNGNVQNIIPNIHNCHEYYTYYLSQQLLCNLSVTQTNNVIEYSVIM